MERQKDWFTGINYHDNYKEQEIILEEQVLAQPGKPGFHEQVELLYVQDGEGELEVNGLCYPMKRGSFFCLYAHHFHGVTRIKQPVRVFSVKFYIGLFMYRSWEKHPKNAHEKLVYDTCPYVFLKGKERAFTEGIIAHLREEKEGQDFEKKNLIVYFTLALHAYHCRYAYAVIGKQTREKSPVWKAVENTILSTQEKISLEKLALEAGCIERTLNRKIKEASGYTFFQLQQYGKVLNACALMHFPELSLDYIGDLLGFSSKTAFYRVFGQYMGMTPREYQERSILGNVAVQRRESLGLQILQYLHLHFHEEISLQDVCTACAIKPYTAMQMFTDIFGKNFAQLLSEIRIAYSCSYMRAADTSLLEISGRCGFNSFSTFQREFAICMGQTPGEYRSYLHTDKKQGLCKNKNKTI